MEIKIPEQLNQQADLTVNSIGFNKYQNLKNLPASTLTELEISQISEYESRYLPSKEQIEASKKHIARVTSKKEEQEFKMTARQLWNVFKHSFFQLNSKEFKKDDFTSKNIEPLIYYFSKDERFFQCENIIRLSEPSFDKGLLIIGTYGNGKTTVMKTFEHIFRNIKGLSFKGYSANDVVTMYERCNDSVTKAELNFKINSGSRFFDDVKTEREVSNYGKVNIFKDIFEIRYSNRITRKNDIEIINKTHITCNYKEGFEGNVKLSIEEFYDRYGARVYDRMFDMFNIIEFKGESFRK